MDWNRLKVNNLFSIIHFICRKIQYSYNWQSVCLSLQLWTDISSRSIWYIKCHIYLYSLYSAASLYCGFWGPWLDPERVFSPGVWRYAIRDGSTLGLLHIIWNIYIESQHFFFIIHFICRKIQYSYNWQSACRWLLPPPYKCACSRGNHGTVAIEKNDMLARRPMVPRRTKNGEGKGRSTVFCSV